MHRKVGPKKALTYVGNLLVVVAFAYIVRAIVNMHVDWTYLLRPWRLAAAVGFVLVYAVAIYLSAYAWTRILEFLSRTKVPRRSAVGVYLKANLGKYLPGNVMHFVGRNMFGASLGLRHSQIALGSAIEVAMIVATCAILSLTLAGQQVATVVGAYAPGRGGLMLAIGLPVVLALLLAAFAYLRRHREQLAELRGLAGARPWRFAGQLFGVYVLTQVLPGSVLSVVVAWGVPLSPRDFLFVMSAYIVAWLMGFVVPGAPGGVGIREAALLLLLSGLVPQEVLLPAVVIQRIVSILGDILAWAAWSFRIHGRRREVSAREVVAPKEAEGVARVEEEQLLVVAIPTFNRCDVLARNLRLLSQSITDAQLESEVGIAVSNNASSDSTRSVVERFILENPRLRIDYLEQSENIGLERNALALARRIRSPYLMYLGDDDFIDVAYLRHVVHELRTGDLSCVIPSYKNITPDGDDVGMARDLDAREQVYPAGFASARRNSWRGHQMSGLVFRPALIASTYEASGASNIYPFVFFVLISTLHGPCLHAPAHPVLVTRPEMSEKAWGGYGDDGRIQAIFDNYAKAPELSAIQKGMLEITLLDRQYWRYAMYVKFGIGSFLKAVARIATGENTIWWVRMMTPFLIPAILVKKSVGLLFRGALIDTLKVRVDV